MQGALRGKSREVSDPARKPVIQENDSVLFSSALFFCNKSFRPSGARANLSRRRGHSSDRPTANGLCLPREARRSRSLHE